MKCKKQNLALVFLVLSNQLFAQQFEKFSRFYDFDKKVTEWKLQAHYLYLYEYTDSICKRTDYYMKEESVKAIGFFTDTTCKTKIGQYISFYPNKNLESKGAFVKNKKESLWLSYYENGEIKDSSVYKNNNVIGNSYTWFKDGSISVKKEMDADGKGNGKETSFWENGKLDFEGNRQNGKKNGLWVYYHNTGNKSAEIVYENDKIFTSKCFDENGIQQKNCDTSKVPKSFPTTKDGLTLTKYMQIAFKKNTDWQSRDNDIPFGGGSFFVWVSFNLDINGKISNIKLEHGAVESLNKTAIKIFKDLKEMQPAFELNRRLEKQYTQRIEFKFANDRF